MYIWHATHSRRIVPEDTHKEGRHLPEWTYMSPMHMLLIYFADISKLCVWYGIIQYMCILCWRRTGDDDAGLIQWSCYHTERLKWHGALGTERRVRTGGWEAWVRGEGSAGWAERYSCLWDVFLVQGSLIRGTIWGHILGLGRTCLADGGNADDVTCWVRDEWHLGAVHVRIRGLHGLYGSITCLAFFICKRR
jgi:hypothetical protein